MPSYVALQLYDNFRLPIFYISQANNYIFMTNIIISCYPTFSEDASVKIPRNYHVTLLICDLPPPDSS